MDHQEWLGSDVESIAVEKCGIARNGRQCIISDATAPSSVFTELQRVGAHEVLALRDYSYDETHFYGSECGSIAWSLPAGLIPLNAAAGLRALEAAGVAIDDNVVAMAMGSLILTGRRECQRLGNIELVLDVAHNPDAAMELRNFLDLRPLERRTIAIFAVMSDKDCRDMISAVEDVIDEWYLPAGIGGSRGQSPEIVAGFISATAHVGPTFEAAFEGALESLECGGRLIIFGSFFTVGEGMKALESKRLSRLGDQS